MKRHTPGPWEALPPETSHGHWRVLRAGTSGVNEHRVALSCCPADARLIAAAPDLLALLQALYNDASVDLAAWGLAVRQVIANATGETE